MLPHQNLFLLGHGMSYRQNTPRPSESNNDFEGRGAEDEVGPPPGEREEVRMLT